jgi:hypothetical protein
MGTRSGGSLEADGGAVVGADSDSAGRVNSGTSTLEGKGVETSANSGDVLNSGLRSDDSGLL